MAKGKTPGPLLLGDVRDRCDWSGQVSWMVTLRGRLVYNKRLKVSGSSPASRMILAMVMALTGLCRGIVTIRRPSVITMCLPWREMRNPAFSRALTALRWLTPG